MLFLQSKLTLFEFCATLPFKFKQVVEVGVWKPSECRSHGFIKAGASVSLFEPHPEVFQELSSFYSSCPNVALHNLAISNRNGTTKLILSDSSSFIEEISNPPVIQDNPLKIPKQFYAYEVQCRTFDQFDDGKIDILLLDMEGSEWFVINSLKSRPRIVAIETHCENRYTNPFIKDIHNWINENNYKVLFKNTTDSYYMYGADLGWGKGGNDNWGA